MHGEWRKLWVYHYREALSCIIVAFRNLNREISLLSRWRKQIKVSNLHRGQIDVSKVRNPTNHCTRLYLITCTSIFVTSTTSYQPANLHPPSSSTMISLSNDTSLSKDDLRVLEQARQRLYQLTDSLNSLNRDVHNAHPLPSWYFNPFPLPPCPQIFPFPPFPSPPRKPSLTPPPRAGPPSTSASPSSPPTSSPSPATSARTPRCCPPSPCSRCRSTRAKSRRTCSRCC